MNARIQSGVLTALGLALTACAEDRASAAEAAVRAELRDPDSAIFSELSVLDDGRVCGNVNSRNGFGGMSGAEPFIVEGDAVSFLPQELYDIGFDMERLAELQQGDMRDKSDYELDRIIELSTALPARLEVLEPLLAPFRDCPNMQGLMGDSAD